MDLLELAARCEAAEVESKELFVAAWDASLGFSARSIRSGSPYQRFLACCEIGAWLDAAMTLVPEGWQDDIDCEFGIGKWGERLGNQANLVTLSSGDLNDPKTKQRMGRGATPALALCAAALRARAAQ